jgi:disulfide bond formation protein DsbB
LFSQPKLPAIPGLETFAGQVMHTARWDHNHDLTSKRVAVIGMGFLFLAAGLHNPGRIGGRVYALLLAAVALLGAAAAGRHVWLQNLPPDRVPACGPVLDYMLGAFPLTEVLEMVLSGSGECAEIKWSFLGLSMPLWVLIVLLLMGGFGCLLNWSGKMAVPLPARR